MHANCLKSCAWVALIFALSMSAKAQTLYAVTIRDAIFPSQGGSLYSVDPQTGAARMIAPIRLNGTQPIGLKGIAVHPKTGVFYGITAGLTRTVPRSLVTFDPESGNATLIGSLGMAGSDITFDRAGTLYIWLMDLNRIGVVDLGTGAARPLEGPVSGISETVGGGFAVRKDGTAVISAASAAGALDFVDLKTGAAREGPSLIGAPFVSAITAMDFSPTGDLYGVNSNMGAPAKTALVRIDISTGRVQHIGPLPDDVYALTFVPNTDLVTLSLRLPRWIVIVLGLFVFAVLLLAARGAWSLMSRP